MGRLELELTFILISHLIIIILSSQELQTNDALAVEATSYALLTLFLVEGGGVTIVQVRDCFNLFLFYQNPIFSG